MHFSRELVHDIFDELMPLLSANNDETGCLKAEAFQPDSSFYKKVEDSGSLRLFTARKNSELVGYCSYFVNPHPHYPGQVFACQDALYLKPAFRGRTGVKFIKWMDEELKSSTDFVLRQVTLKRDYSRTLTSMGYQPLTLTLMRSL